MSYKIGIDVKKLAYLDQLRAFDTVARDPRGHAVSIAYIAADNSVKPTKTAAEVAFFPVDNLPELAYDHQDIIQLGRDRLILEVNHTNLIKTLLPPLFTMADIQAAYEAVFGRELDKRNFQKKFFKLNQVTATGKFKYNANSRPAKLYKFNTSTINQLSNNLD